MAALPFALSSIVCCVAFCVVRCFIVSRTAFVYYFVFYRFRVVRSFGSSGCALSSQQINNVPVQAICCFQQRHQSCHFPCLTEDDTRHGASKVAARTSIIIPIWCSVVHCLEQVDPSTRATHGISLSQWSCGSYIKDLIAITYGAQGSQISWNIISTVEWYRRIPSNGLCSNNLQHIIILISTPCALLWWCRDILPVLRRAFHLFTALFNQHSLVEPYLIFLWCLSFLHTCRKLLGQLFRPVFKKLVPYFIPYLSSLWLCLTPVCVPGRLNVYRFRELASRHFIIHGFRECLSLGLCLCRTGTFLSSFLWFFGTLPCNVPDQNCCLFQQWIQLFSSSELSHIMTLVRTLLISKWTRPSMPKSGTATSVFYDDY